jgi:hypothetical protein
MAPYAAMLLVGLVIGFFAGQEYLRYEIRSAFTSAAQGVAQGFHPDAPSAPAEGTPSAPPAPKEPSPVEVQLTAKDFQDSDYSKGVSQALTFSLAIHNLTGKDIRAFDGEVTFTDLLGNEITSSKLAINDPIKAGATLNWDGQMDYNQFEDGDQRFRGADMANIKTVFRPHKVLYTDGSEKTFE